MAQTVKLLPAMWETWVQSLGRDDLLEKEMATHSSILSWKILWTEEPGRLQSMEGAEAVSPAARGPSCVPQSPPRFGEKPPGDAACPRMWQQNSSPKAIYPT